jgi:hypothetical protein
MRRFDPLTLSLFMLPLESDWLRYSTRSSRPLPEPEPVEDTSEEPINSWETAWIDLGGEG